LLVSSWHHKTSAQVVPQSKACHASAKQMPNKKFVRRLCESSPIRCHFSEWFLEVYEITKLAKVSSFGPASAFYQKLFGNLQLKRSLNLIWLTCQRLNDHMIRQLGFW
jgi:hypothetical protein